MRRGSLALAALGTALRLALVWSGACDNHVVADDAFYYFTIARHLAAGHGPTFDGLAPTNGFHPLWLLVVTPLFALARATGGGAWLPVHLALSLCALLDLASGLALRALLTRLGFPRGAGVAAAVWFLSPFTVLLSLRGMESALDVALVALWALALARALAAPAPRTGDGLALGALSGLAFLASTDNGPLLALALAAPALGRAALGRAPWRPTLAFLAAAGAVAALVALPWFAWNLAAFGTPFQVSGAVKLQNPQVFGHVPRNLPDTARYLAAFLWAPAYFVAGESMRFRPAFLVVATALVAAALALLPFLGLALARRRGGPAPWVALAFLAYLAGHAAVYALVLRAYVIWYATVPFFLVVGLAGMAGEEAFGPRGRGARRAQAALALAAAALGFVQFFRATGVRPRGEEEAVRGIFLKIARLAPGARRVGVFNAGAAGYFAPGFGPFTVVNLDGLVNNAAVAAWRRGRYLEYLERTVDVVIVDAAGTLDVMLGPGGRARFEARFPRWSRGSLIHGPRPGLPAR